MRLIAEPAIENGAVGVDTAVAEERPIAAGVFASRGIALDDQNFLLVVWSFGNHLSKRVGDERISPEFETGIAVLGLAFVANAIYHCDVNAVGDSVSALDGAPRIKLGGAEFLFFVRMPSDAGGIENDL